MAAATHGNKTAMETAVCCAILLLAMAATSAGCPSQCTCTRAPTQSLISCRQVTTLPDFSNLTNVPWDVLSISGNYLNRIPSEAFKGLNISKLHLNDNHITDIEHGAFNGINGLRLLDLGYNALKRVDNGIFGNLTELEQLALEKNQIATVGEDAFDGSTNLIQLTMNSNFMTEIPIAALKPLVSLKRLYLQSNRINVIPGYAFETLQKLEVLNIGINRPPFVISDEAFCLSRDLSNTSIGAPKRIRLSMLFLDGNKLRGVDPCALKEIWTLRILDLGQSPLTCDCNLFSHKRMDRDLGEAQCSTPPRFLDKFVRDIPNRDFKDCSINATLAKCSERLCTGLPRYSTPRPNRSNCLIVQGYLIVYSALLQVFIAWLLNR